MAKDNVPRKARGRPRKKPKRLIADKGYDKAQRVHVLGAGGSRIRFKLEASEESPALNPCILVKNWGSRTAKAEVKTNSSLRQIGPAVLQGIVTETDGSPSLVNGKDFAGSQHTDKSIAVHCCFANPYSSYQRGANENTKGVLRQFFPRGTEQYAVAPLSSFRGFWHDFCQG